MGVLGAVSGATAALLPGSPAAAVAELDGPTDGTTQQIVCEHPTGEFTAAVSVRVANDGAVAVERAGIVRTARKLMDGTAFPRDH